MKPKGPKWLKQRAEEAPYGSNMQVICKALSALPMGAGLENFAGVLLDGMNMALALEWGRLAVVPAPDGGWAASVMDPSSSTGLREVLRLSGPGALARVITLAYLKLGEPRGQLPMPQPMLTDEELRLLGRSPRETN
jgi:hypothetical protein